MGGPCYILTKCTKLKGPEATDNFQIAPFIYNGRLYQSCEQAYQANKFEEDSEEHELIRNILPLPGESDLTIPYGRYIV